MNTNIKEALRLAEVLFDGFDLVERLLDTDDNPSDILAAVRGVVGALRAGIERKQSPVITQSKIDEMLDDLLTTQKAQRAKADEELRKMHEKPEEPQKL